MKPYITDMYFMSPITETLIFYSNTRILFQIYSKDISEEKKSTKKNLNNENIWENAVNVYK